MKNALMSHRLSYLALLIFGIFIQSCNIDKIEDELSPDLLAKEFVVGSNDIPFEGTCRFDVGGVIIDSKTCLPIEDAKVEFLRDDQTRTTFETDTSGRFNFITLFDSSLDSAVINITREDYTQSRFVVRAEDYFDVDACRGNTCYFTCIDFLLTPKQEVQVITQDWGEWYINDEVTLFENGKMGPDCETEYHINIPENTVRDGEAVPMVYTPLDMRQYLCGDLPTEPIVAAFEAKPDDYTFLIPLELSFIPARDIPFDAIYHCYYFNEDTNSWEEDKDAVINRRLNKLEVDIDRLDCLHIITYTIPWDDEDVSPIEIVSDEMDLGENILDSYTIGNCDCNMMMVDTINTVFERDRNMESLRFPFDKVSEKETEIYLNDLRRIFCVPAKTTGALDYKYNNNDGSRLTLNTKVKMQLSPFFLQECDNFEIFVTEKYRRITGSYQNLYFEYDAVIRTDFRKIKIDCPTTSGCHQGCGD